MTHTRRRLTLGVTASTLLGGCGFHPLLAPGNGSANSKLRTVFVPVMPERSGQLFREALQARLDGSASSVPKRYELSAPLAVAVEGLGIQRDTSTTRFRITGSTSWTLTELTPQRPIVTTGYARLLDGYDNINQQYLSTAFGNEDAVRRITSNLADRVVQQLASYFDRQV